MPGGKMTINTKTPILKLTQFKDIHEGDRGVLYSLHRAGGETGRSWGSGYWSPSAAFPAQDSTRGKFSAKWVSLTCWGDVAVTSLITRVRQQLEEVELERVILFFSFYPGWLTPQAGV